jgi:hypothetical protein
MIQGGYMLFEGNRYGEFIKSPRTCRCRDIYVHANIPELLNIQNINGQAKPYQVKQLLRLVERYNLEMGDES